MKPMVYSEEFPAIDLFKDYKSLVNKALFHKSILWSYENEVRIVKKTQGAHPFLPSALTQITFGCMIGRNPVEELRFAGNLPKIGFGHVDVVAATQDKSYYKLYYSERWKFKSK